MEISNMYLWWSLIYGPLMFGLGGITGFFWSRYVQYGKIADAWGELRKEYEHLEREYKSDDVNERKKVKGQSLGT